MRHSIGTYFAQYFKMPHLFRDDLGAIEKILRTLKPDHYRLSCQGFEYDAIDEMPQDLGEVNVLVVYTHNPCTRLKFSRSWAELYCGEENPEVHTAVQNIAQIILSTERRSLWNFCNSSFWLAPLIGCGSFALGMTWISMGLLSHRFIYLISLLMLGMSIWWAIGYRFKLQRFSCIDLSQSRGQVNWLVEHRQTVILFAAGMALGLIMAILLVGFFQS